MLQLMNHNILFIHEVRCVKMPFNGLVASFHWFHRTPRFHQHRSQLQLLGNPTDARRSTETIGSVVYSILLRTFKGSTLRLGHYCKQIKYKRIKRKTSMHLHSNMEKYLIG
ncbi:hypothetical protein ILYODFUR_038201 [Ilyodon furcidens]|uniref:Uncharacterized protein n=1 Tax=Ilyodon furcidens TaxID=33524 RepID=A0ABV0T3X0_9TELE